MSRLVSPETAMTRIRHFQRRLLDPKGEIVSAAELFAFPRAEAVRANEP